MVMYYIFHIWKHYELGPRPLHKTTNTGAKNFLIDLEVHIDSSKRQKYVYLFSEQPCNIIVSTSTPPNTHKMDTHIMKFFL